MKHLLIFFVLLIGIASPFPGYALHDDGIPDEAALENIDAIQAVAIANQWKWSRKEIKSSVTSREVIFQFPDGKMKNIPLSEDRMVVALAPYIEETHPCTTHNFSSCQGEQVQQKFYVRAVDQNGNILVDTTVTTLQNGFFELWLPRNRKVEMSIQGFDLIAKDTIETFADSKTCVTTFQLK